MGDILAATPVSYSYLILGGFVVAFSMVSLLVKEKLFIGEVVLGTGFGVLIGPYCANIFDPRSWTSNSNGITLEFMRVVLATGLFAIGVELPTAYVAKHVKSLLIVVVPTMAFGWFVCAGFIRILFPNLNFVSSLVISACLTPTDPVLASAVIGGKFAVKNVPSHIRMILAAESAANDGLAYPFLSISVYLTVEASKKVAFEKWILIGWLYQVIFGTVLGAFLGWGFSFLMRRAHRKGLIDRESLVAQYISLAVFTIGVVSTIGSDDLLAAFAAGTAMSWDGHFKEKTEGEVFSSVIDLVLNCACFIYIGAWLPFNQYDNELFGITPWRLVLLFVAILAFRRIPAILLVYKWTPDIYNWREALFCSHFGPMGVGAIFISTLAITHLSQWEDSDNPTSEEQRLAAMLHPIVSFVVLCSILTHGLSIPVYWFGRKAAARTLTFTLSRSRTQAEPAQPDWLLWERRTPRVERAGNNDFVLHRDVESDAPAASESYRNARLSASGEKERDELLANFKGEEFRLNEEKEKGNNSVVGESIAAPRPHANASEFASAIVGESATGMGRQQLDGNVAVNKSDDSRGNLKTHNSKVDASNQRDDSASRTETMETNDTSTQHEK
ncbi:hypothetical protein SCHPADRAFT_925181 [Schizopora paradoxa]|uniref:Cation/H+ exchanger transmembrane domain-containing protein n=1 Tax=Schizopora paradoxa TaxID=27342 RepID=A0A0H2SMQ0_9AGAM|nr:hypothetical protein SCHPADRAFT_925181 [Schizopora paradoxa]